MEAVLALGLQESEFVCVFYVRKKQEKRQIVVGQDGQPGDSERQGLKEELRKIGLITAVLDRKSEKTKQRCTEDMPEREQGGSETLSQTRQTGRGCSGDEGSRRRKDKTAKRK